MAYVLTVSHVDTCFPDYLTDHHNRDGEALLGVYVDGASTMRQVREDLEEEAMAYLDCPEEISDDAIRAAIAAEFANVDAAAPFDSSLETAGDGEETPQAWFLFEWSEDED